MRNVVTLAFTLLLAACNSGVEPASPAAHPRLTKADFAGYLSALKAHDYDGFSRYYTPDVRLFLPDGQTLDHDAIVMSERTMAAQWDWTMDVEQVVLDEDGIALHAKMHGPIRQDAPNFFGPGPAGSPKGGETWQDNFVVFYKLRDAKIAEIHFSDLGYNRQQ